MPLVNLGKKLQEENMFIKGQHGCHSAPKSKLKWVFLFSFLQHNEYPATPSPKNNNNTGLYLMTEKQREDGKCQLYHRNKAICGIYAWNNWRQESEDNPGNFFMCTSNLFAFLTPSCNIFSAPLLYEPCSPSAPAHNLPVGKLCTLYWGSCMVIFLLLIWIPVVTHLTCWLHVKMLKQYEMRAIIFISFSDFSNIGAVGS